MKHAKKLASLLLALVLVFSLTATAFAEETTYSISINNSTEGHTYEAYQIFTGDLSEKDGKKVLSNIVWGSGVSEAGQTALGDAAAKAETLKTEADAKAFAKAVAPYLTTAAGSANTVTDGKYVISGLAAGYYLVKDKDGSVTGEGDAYTEYIVQVVGNVTADPKSDASKVVKKVKDTNDSTGETSGWQDSADYDIGDSVPFQLTATLADNVSAYYSYKVVFHDTLSAGLTYNNDAVVKVGENVIYNAKGASQNKTGVSVSYERNVLTVTILDVKAEGINGTDNSVVTVDYTATLNENAAIGSAGNPNKVYLEYSNNPNWTPGEGEGPEDSPTGDTPEDTVIVFTYKTIINKVEPDGNDKTKALTGAAFKLEKLIKGAEGAENTWKTVKEFTVDDQNPTSTFTFEGLDDGTYKLTETVTPKGYNTIDPITFNVTANHSDGDTPALTDLNGEKVTGEITFTKDVSAGSLSSDVVNKAGTTLPETGGMGTTIFYILGSVLLVGAAILLITKKRMSAEK